MSPRILSVAALAVSMLLPCLAAGAESQKKSPHNIHPDAYVHPSVIMMGKVTVGAYTYVDAGTVLTGKVKIGHHCVVRCNVTMRGNVTLGNYFGLISKQWTIMDGKWIEGVIRFGILIPGYCRINGRYRCVNTK